MTDKKFIVVDVEENPNFTLEALCHACHTTPDFIQTLIDYGIIESDQCLFNADHLRRVRMVLRLQQDLEINLAGAALVLDMSEEMEKMRSRIQSLERFFFLKS